jgi:fatty-acyl-CoA synthase
LYTHPKVLDVQIVGVPDEKYGEIPVAFVRKKEGTDCSEEEIRQFCTGKIAKYKIPEHVIFVDSYPMTASGKIQKYKLREQFMINRQES